VSPPAEPGVYLIKLSSEHGKTQLNLGYLIHPRTDGKGEPRGEGFELRSDKQGAIRASGLIISTEAKGGASGTQLDRSPAQSQLESALETAKNLGEYATKQLADSIETGDDEQTVKPDNSAGDKATHGHLYHHVHASKSLAAGSNTDKDGKTKSKEQAGLQKIILLHGEDGVAITTPQSHTISAGSNLDQVAQRDTNQSTGRRWIHNVGQHISLFTGGIKDKITLKLIAAKGQLQMQAQSDDIEITADKNAKFTAIKGKGLFNAKQEILLTAGGAYIRIKGGKIELHAPGKVSIKGGSHDWGGPARLDNSLPAMPTYTPAKGPYTAKYQLFKTDNRPFEDYNYEVRGADGELLNSGLTDASGRTQFTNTDEAKPIKVFKSVMRESERITEKWDGKLDSAVTMAKSKGVK
jgi:type VI secretion system secreted protein VgrG